MAQPPLFCSMCGTKVTNPSARFCSSCGAPLAPATEPAKETFLPTQLQTVPEISDQSPKTPEERPATKTSFAHDTIVGVDLLAGEKILRVTPCRLKTFTQVKDCVLYVTAQRLICTSTSKGMFGAMTKVAGKPTDNIELTIQLQNTIRAELRDGKLKLTFLGGDGKTSSAEYVVGIAAPDLGDFIMQARQGSHIDLESPIIDEYDDSSEIKSSLGKGLSITGKVLYTGAKVGAKVTSQLYQEFLKDSESDFEDAAMEEDHFGWSGRTGPKGRKAEKRVAEALKLTGWIVKGRNVRLQEREIDIWAQKGERKYMVECKFGRKQIDTAGLDSYVMLYYDAKQKLGLNGLLFVCPTAGISEYAKSNILIKYPNENIRIVDSRNWLKEFEEI